LIEAAADGSPEEGAAGGAKQGAQGNGAAATPERAADHPPAAAPPPAPTSCPVCWLLAHPVVSNSAAAIAQSMVRRTIFSSRSVNHRSFS